MVGGRPFSWGGVTWKNPKFYQDRFGVSGFEASAARIMAAVRRATCETVIFLGHCGPSGLGDRPEDPCGKDWKPIGGDYGDPDLAAAVNETRNLGRTVPLVAFGHMHHRLRHTQERLRTPVSLDAEGTVYLNAASVPRITQTETSRCRNFSLVSLEADKVLEVSLVWLNQDFSLQSQQILYSQTEPLVGVKKT